MKNSRIKLQRQATHPYFTYSQTSENQLCPESKHQHQGKHDIKTNSYESDYNYFIGRMEAHPQLEHKQNSLTHHRHASLGNSRTFALAQRPFVSPTFTPYLQFHPKQKGSIEATPRNSVKVAQLSKQSSKLSMKNAYKDIRGSNNYASSNVKQSQASTLHQNTSRGSKMVQARPVDTEIYGYFKSVMEKRANQFRMQIDEQASLIKNLQYQITILSKMVKQKQEIILSLPMAHIYKRISIAQQEINIHINNRLKKQAEIQNSLNLNINSIMQALKSLINAKNQIQIHRAAQIGQVRKTMEVIRQVFQENRKIMSEFICIKENVSSITKNCRKIQQVLKEEHKDQGENMLNQTGSFGCEWKNKQKELKQKNELNESTSYFFHPSEFTNMDKFAEIFVKRQGEPVRCYTDSLNQVRYKDTNTFMFNRKGDIVTLSENEKRYYIDKGFIAQCS